MPRTKSTKTSASSSKQEKEYTFNLNDRTLIFVASDLGRDIDLMCTFEKLSDKKLPYDQQQVCWKVIKLGPKGQQSGAATYKANTAFFVPQGDSGNIVYPLTSERVQLKVEGRSFYFSAPEPGADGFLEAVNNLPSAADIGIGFTDENGENVQPGLVFKKVGVGASVKAQFTPILKIYATSNYQESEIIRGEVVYPLVWQQDLMKLDSTTRLRVTIDPIANVPKIRLA